MKTKCDYCGSYIKDTDERCSSCGAINPNFKRQTDGTPSTIEQLQDWYRVRNLPPEEVTRFFIGKDVKEPRAFGIYRDEQGMFVVYKNKANGERAVRYRGSDEAYAVNELYLRLKEEILNQKAHNVSNRNVRGVKKRKSPVRRIIGAFILVQVVMILIGAISAGFSSYTERKSIQSGRYYVSESPRVMYYADYSSDWYTYRFKDDTWFYLRPRQGADDFPDGIEKGTKPLYSWEAAEKLGLDEELVDCTESHAYIDRNPKEPYHSGYYYNDGNYYYYLNDSHSYKTDIDSSGWYIYQDDGWSYLCDYEDKDSLGDDLWYNGDDYRVSDRYEDAFAWDDNSLPSWMSGSLQWTPSDFTDTQWYAAYSENERIYQEDVANRETYSDSHSSWDWSSDSSYDWSSSDSWDSGSTDWDSDW